MSAQVRKRPKKVELALDKCRTDFKPFANG